MTDVSGTKPNMDLTHLLATTLHLVRAVIDNEAAWATPTAGSPAAAEMAAEDARPDRPTGSWPWKIALIVARWGLQVAVEIADGFAVELQRGGTACPASSLWHKIFRLILVDGV